MASEALIETLGRQENLSRITEALQPKIRQLFEGGELSAAAKDFLHGVWLGHPLHPVLTDIPVGAWTTALALDGAALLSDNEALESAADVAVGIGLAGAVASAVTGLTDWSETDGRARNIGIVHGSLNLAAAALYATSLALRRTNRRSAGIGTSLLGFAIASFSAYLGGHLTYGEQIGVDHTATPDRGKPEEFTTVIKDEELPENTPTRVTADGVNILLVKQNGRIRALTETCSHLGGPLAEGKLEGNSIQCPWHGSKFCLDDGSVVGGPATFPAPCFDVRLSDGMVQVRSRKV